MCSEGVGSCLLAALAGGGPAAGTAARPRPQTKAGCKGPVEVQLVWKVAGSRYFLSYRTEKTQIQVQDMSHAPSKRIRQKPAREHCELIEACEGGCHPTRSRVFLNTSDHSEHDQNSRRTMCVFRSANGDHDSKQSLANVTGASRQ